MAITSQEIDESFAVGFFWDSDHSSEAAAWLAEDLYREYEQQQVIRWGGDCLDDVLENLDAVRVLQEESRQYLETEPISKCDQDAVIVVSAMLLDSTEVTGNRYRFSKYDSVLEIQALETGEAIFQTIAGKVSKSLKDAEPSHQEAIATMSERLQGALRSVRAAPVAGVER